MITPTLGPIFIAPNTPPASKTVKIGPISKDFEGIFPVRLETNDYVPIEPGPNQEVVQLTSATGPSGQITAIFARSHPAGVAVIKVHSANSSSVGPAGHPGHPGPQRNFNVRNPLYAGVVRHFSIIE